MRHLLFTALALGCLHLSSPAADIAARFAEPERLYKEGSYKRAHDEYQKLADTAQTPEERRWVQFRLAETLARSEGSTRQPDDSAYRKAEADLRQFIDANEPVERVWAEAHEALGDLGWFGRQQRNWGGGWPHYERALDYWAGSTNVVVAAERYWQIITKAPRPRQVEPSYYYGYYGNF